MALDTDSTTNDGTSGPSAPEPDLTGRSRLTWNVLWSWAGHFVFIIAGFIVPRMIDRRLGQEALGVWDFSWSIVAYFILVQGGVVSSINRYVAKYRAIGDVDGVNRSVSTVTAILAVMTLFVFALTASSALLLPNLFGDRLGAYQSDAQWAVFWLGLSLGFQLLLSGYGGVVTGCHRWDLHNAIHAGSHVVTVSGMIIIMVFGGGLPALALMNLVGDLSGRIVRGIVAHRVCPGLKVRPSLVSWAQAREMLRFGGKSFVPHLGNLLLNQTTSVMVLAYLGPAAMAVFARPRALIRHVNTLVSKFAFVLTPTVSSLQATSQRTEVRELLVSSVRWAGYLTMPMVLGLAMLGHPLLRVWMGETYADQGAIVLVVFAFGYLAVIIQTTTRSVLQGLDLHGRPGLADLVASVLALGFTVVALGPLEGGLVGVALAVSVPLTIANGIYVPYFACRQLGVPIRRYITDTMVGPTLCGIPFAMTLAAASALFGSDPLAHLLAGGLGGGVVLAVLYWLFVLPTSFKRRVIERLGLASRSRATQSL